MSFEFLGGRRLLLAGSRLGWFWILALAVAVILLVVLYREERRLVTRRAGLFLLCLRLIAAAALAFALFEPIAARTLIETQRGRVIVAVDVSESMTTVDVGRTSEQNAKLAQVLLLDRGDEAARLSRREVARRLIDGASSPVGKLEKEHTLDPVAFHRETAPASLVALAESLKSAVKAGDSSLLETDWTPVLARALQPGSTRQEVTGVVLLTDGRRNGPIDPLPTIDRLAARGIPVYSVLIGSSTPPRDAAVAVVKAPESVYRGDVATVSAAIKIDGYAGRDVAVTLERPGASPLRQTVQAPATSGAPRPVVSFAVPLDQTGTVAALRGGRAARGRRAARQRPADHLDPGRRRQGEGAAHRQRAALGAALPAQCPRARHSRRAADGGVSSNACERRARVTLMKPWCRRAGRKGNDADPLGLV